MKHYLELELFMTDKPVYIDAASITAIVTGEKHSYIHCAGVEKIFDVKESSDSIIKKLAELGLFTKVTL